MGRMRFPWRSIVLSAFAIGIGVLILEAPPSPQGASTDRSLPWQTGPAEPAAEQRWTSEARVVDPQAQNLTRLPDARPVKAYPDVVEVPRTVKSLDSVTIDIGAETLRFASLVPVPPNAMCGRRGGGKWPCGMRGRTAVRALVVNKALECRPMPSTPERRHVDCRLSGSRLSVTLVEQGWAIPAAPGDVELDQALETARQKRAGVWGSSDLDGLSPGAAFIQLAGQG